MPCSKAYIYRPRHGSNGVGRNERRKSIGQNDVEVIVPAASFAVPGVRWTSQYVLAASCTWLTVTAPEAPLPLRLVLTSTSVSSQPEQTCRRGSSPSQETCMRRESGTTSDCTQQSATPGRVGTKQGTPRRVLGWYTELETRGNDRKWSNISLSFFPFCSHSLSVEVAVPVAVRRSR